MDPRDRADALLAKARARRGGVVTPQDATSPMDADNTDQFPRTLIEGLDRREREEPVTASLPAPGTVGTERHRADPHGGERTDELPAPAARAAGQPANPQPADAAPDSAAEDEPAEHTRTQQRELPGVVPTTAETPTRRLSLSDRLGGRD
ncbi:MAG: hypothetical protein ACRDRL_20515 [Sciscionella sp.]